MDPLHWKIIKTNKQILKNDLIALYKKPIHFIIKFNFNEYVLDACSGGPISAFFPLARPHSMTAY